MHILGDVQRRPTKRRSPAEGNMMSLHSLATGVMFGCLVVGGTQLTMRSMKTFDRNFWFDGNDVRLHDVLAYKLANCTYQAQYSLSSFGAVEPIFSSRNAIDQFTILGEAIKMNLGIAFATLVLAIVNRNLFSMNFFEFRYRNYVIRKSSLTTLELLFAIFGMYNLSTLDVVAKLLRAYLSHCGVTSNRSLPFGVFPVAIIVFYAVEFFVHFVALCLLLLNGLRRPHEADLKELKEDMYEYIDPNARNSDDDEEQQIIVYNDDGTPMRTTASQQRARMTHPRQ